MVNFLAGVFALLLLILFLGKYAVSINSIPLWIIILGSVALAISDFVTSMRKQNGNGTPGGG